MDPYLMTKLALARESDLREAARRHALGRELPRATPRRRPRVRLARALAGLAARLEPRQPAPAEPR